MANQLLNWLALERSTWLSLSDAARRALREHDHVALFEMGAHPFLTLTLFIAMFERDHGPLEYQKAYGRALRHLSLPTPTSPPKSSPTRRQGTCRARSGPPGPGLSADVRRARGPLGDSASDSATFSSAALRSRSAKVLGYTNNSLSAEERNDALRAVLDHAGHGRLAVAHSTRELADVETAWREQSGRKSAGRVILTVT